MPSFKASPISFLLGRFYLICMVLLTSVTSAYATDATDATDAALISDVQLYVTAPLRWDGRDWSYAGAAVLAVAAAHRYDTQVREHFAGVTSNGGGDSHGSSDALPAAAMLLGTGALAWVLDDRAGYRETKDMLEAGVFTAATTFALKQVARRERPDATSDSNAWFKGGDSFPSMHVSVTMAIGTVLAESGGDEFRWVRRGLGYGLGAYTAYARLKHQQHWLSDTVAGAALGMASGRFVLNRHSPTTALASWTLLPDRGGLAFTYAAAFE